MKVQKIALALVMGAAATGCATVTRGTAQDFTVETTPSGAYITTSNGFECAASPCTFRMQRKNGFTVTAALEGYHTAEATVTSQFSSAGGAGMAGNVLVGGLIGVGIDATSGAMNDLRPNPLHITLEEEVEEVAATVSMATETPPAVEAAPADPAAAPAEETAAPAPTPSN